MPKYSMQDMKEKYIHFDATPRGQAYGLAVLAELNERLDKLEHELAFERKVNDRVNEIFKGWFHREG